MRLARIFANGEISLAGRKTLEYPGRANEKSKHKSTHTTTIIDRSRDKNITRVGFSL